MNSQLTNLLRRMLRHFGIVNTRSKIVMERGSAEIRTSAVMAPAAIYPTRSTLAGFIDHRRKTAGVVLAGQAFQRRAL